MSKYTEQENNLLLTELSNAGNTVNADAFKLMSEFWPSFFNGTQRGEYALYLQTLSLAKKAGLNPVINSIPKRDRSNWKAPKKIPARYTKGKTHAQIMSICHQEIQIAIKKTTAKIMRLMEDLNQENTELKNELRDLRPYKKVVENAYQRELGR